MYYLVFIYFILFYCFFILCILVGPITQDQGPFFSKVLGPNPGPFHLFQPRRQLPFAGPIPKPKEAQCLFSCLSDGSLAWLAYGLPFLATSLNCLFQALTHFMPGFLVVPYTSKPATDDPATVFVALNWSATPATKAAPATHLLT